MMMMMMIFYYLLLTLMGLLSLVTSVKEVMFLPRSLCWLVCVLAKLHIEYRQIFMKFLEQQGIGGKKPLFIFLIILA